MKKEKKRKGANFKKVFVKDHHGLAGWLMLS
jgi:hypothetical protein